MIHKCPQCQIEFHYRTATRKYCSKRCKNKGLTVPLDTKQIYAEYDAGATMREIALKCNVSQTPIRMALLKEGLHLRHSSKKSDAPGQWRDFPISCGSCGGIGFYAKCDIFGGSTRIQIRGDFLGICLN